MRVHCTSLPAVLTLACVPFCPLTRYKMVLTVDNRGKVTVVDKRDIVTILFNPWSSGEGVGREERRQEEHRAEKGGGGGEKGGGGEGGQWCWVMLRHSTPYLSGSEDTCYYPETGELREYVLNNQGRIWVGSAESNWGRPWQFAQFTRDSLEVALFMLNKMDKWKRKDPVWVRVGEGEGEGEREKGVRVDCSVQQGHPVLRRSPGTSRPW